MSERKKFETKLNLSNKLVEAGLWTTETDMNLVLKDLTDKEKREKIVTQINYYKKVSSFLVFCVSLNCLSIPV
jgi:hypothetical protein